MKWSKKGSATVMEEEEVEHEWTEEEVETGAETEDVEAASKEEEAEVEAAEAESVGKVGATDLAFKARAHRAQ